MQSAASITDQVRICRARCETKEWVVTHVLSDEAISGATHLRTGFQSLLRLIAGGDCDVIVAESLDRLSRDQEHIAGLYKQARFHGVRIETCSEGEISEMHIGLGGTMSALFLRQLAQKTHRGLEVRVRSGKSAGGICYGYRVDRHILPDGSVSTGDVVIKPDEANIIQRIFEAYASGQSPRTIVAALNAEGISPPRLSGKNSGDWSFSTLSGNWKRGTGILNNDLYIGQRVWNRQRFLKNPDTGKRQARLNPPDMWVTTEAPDLRIIDDALWDKVKLASPNSAKRSLRRVTPDEPPAPRRRDGPHISCQAFWNVRTAAPATA